MAALSSGIGLTGRIETTGTPALLRSIEKDKLSGELAFKRDGERVDLYFLFGQLYHSRWSDVVGIDAVSELLSWKTGAYSFTEGLVPAQASISDDVDRILAAGTQRGEANGSRAVTPAPARRSPNPTLSPHSMNDTPPPSPVPVDDLLGSGGFDSLVPFDFSMLDNEPSALAIAPDSDPISELELLMRPSAPAENVDHSAPAPPGDGFYRTHQLALPAGEQMATSLLATGPELHQELQQLSDVGFTGYVLGSPDVGGIASVGMAFLKGRFIHAFALAQGTNGTGGAITEGEAAYRALLNQSPNASRYYWFYELTSQLMYPAISLMTPPQRYVNLEVRILRFKEVLRVLNEENVTGCVTITLGHMAGIPATHQGGAAHGTRAYIPLHLGEIMGMWTYGNPKVVNDGTLLQRFLSEPSARIDLYVTVSDDMPGTALEQLLPATSALPAAPQQPAYPVQQAPAPVTAAPPPPVAASSAAVPFVNDDTRMEQLVLTVGRMESTWTQMRKKGRIDQQTNLLALGGFANEVIALYESVAGRDTSITLINAALRNELQPYNTIFGTLDVAHGRVNMIKLLREYTTFADDSPRAAEGFFREASRALKTLIRSVFQTYVRDLRQESTRWEAQETFEVFLQEVVWKM